MFTIINTENVSYCEPQESKNNFSVNFRWNKVVGNSVVIMGNIGIFTCNIISIFNLIFQTTTLRLHSYYIFLLFPSLIKHLTHWYITTLNIASWCRELLLEVELRGHLHSIFYNIKQPRSKPGYLIPFCFVIISKDKFLLINFPQLKNF